MSSVGVVMAPMAIVPPTDLQLERASPEQGRKMSVDDERHPGIQERTWGLRARVDPSVTFEEYRYWAKIERELEVEENARYKSSRGARTLKSIIKGRFSSGASPEATAASKQRRASAPHTDSQDDLDNKKSGVIAEPLGPQAMESGLEDPEWRRAARALRTASWGGIFYLITTDILGWSSTPFVFASVGYGPGVALYIIFGIFAGLSGWCLWRVFLGLDSSRYPMMSFGDPYLRLFGIWPRHLINIAQSFQMFMTVAVLILGQALIIAQIAQTKICFVACMIIIMVVGMISGAIRTLQSLGWLCNFSVWLNVITFVIICVAAAINVPDYSVITSSTLIKKIGPIVTFAGVPPAEYQQQSHNLFAAEFNAVDSMVYSYAGCLLFIAFLAEMRHPLDFWKGVFLAQAFICFVYIFFGVFVYSYYGQYSASNIGQMVTPYSLQTVQNVLALITGFIAIFLYFNVGLKTVYLEVFQEIMHFPPITTKKGAWCWFALGPIYWILAFVVAASVPNLNTIVGLVGGLFAINFTYSFPPMLYAGFKIHDSATLPGEGFDPVTRVTTRHDNGPKRWMRGIAKSWYVSIPIILYMFAGLVTSGMGSWAAIEGAIAVFGPGGTVATSFGCSVPV